jgi:uncharacterized protein YndB with AHSA1/START domain
MPAYAVAVQIDAPPDQVFAEVADLVRHPPWAADPLTVEPVAPGQPVDVGARYRSVARSKGKTIEAELQVTAYDPPSWFAFTVTDLTGHYEHVFTLGPSGGGTLVERAVTARLSLAQRLLFYAVLPIIKKPNTAAAMRRLKEQVEASAPQ